MPRTLRYTLIQLPEAALVTTASALAWQWGWLSGSGAALVAVLWVLKDIALYPLYRHALAEGPPIGPAALVGAEAVTATALTPAGQVRLRGEIWSARTAASDHIGPGAGVVVVAAEGLVLIVTAQAGAKPFPAARSASSSSHEFRPGN